MPKSLSFTSAQSLSVVAKTNVLDLTSQACRSGSGSESGGEDPGWRWYPFSNDAAPAAESGDASYGEAVPRDAPAVRNSPSSLAGCRVCADVAGAGAGCV